MSAFEEDDPRDVRLGQSWTPLQRAKNDALWVLASLLLAGARGVPRSTLLALGRALGRTAFVLSGRHRRMALANIALALPELDGVARHALACRSFQSLGEVVGDIVSMLPPRAGGAPLVVTEEARAVLDEAIGERRGVVFASAHLGPWERVAASLVAAGIPLVTLARESYDPRFSRVYEQLRAALGVRVVWRGAPGAASRILRTLRSGGVLGAPMDLRSRRVATCPAPFLGHEAPTAVGPARMALRMGAAVVVGTAAPGDDLPLVVTATRIASNDLPRDEAGASELTSRVNAELSRRILAIPHAWPWMHPRWPPRTGV
ncbi:MAG: lysophospholipid acyltransferase family protein [Myxococcota bacterium]|nr:lysophospholipid acyltransferase family protein [Myxococcota bacterium]